jgi:hypothetical protein
MATLHIEHGITDLQTWLGAFGRFAEAETKVWSNPDASPALDGTPRARILNEVSAQ